jgi:hypothetical protein
MRHALYLVGVVTGAWVLVSFAGLMITGGAAEFWTQSLMWSLLTSAVTVPIFFMSRSTLPMPAQDDVSKSVEDVFGEGAEPFVDESSTAVEGRSVEADGNPFDRGGAPDRDAQPA